MSRNRKKKATTKLATLDLVEWVQQMDLTDEEFVEQFQQLALDGQFCVVEKLLPWLPQDVYFDEACTRAREVLDAGQGDVFVLLSRTSGFKQRTRLHRVLPFALLAFVAVCGLAAYAVFNPT